MTGLPLVTVLSLGGTIASAPRGDHRRASPKLGSADIAAAVPGLAEIARLAMRDVAMLPSIDVTFALALKLVEAIREAEQAGSSGVVITQGTDTMEEMAFCLDLLIDTDMPVAMTGAMRHAGLAGSDGPANLLDAVRTVISPQARGLGVTIVMNEEIHAARAVRKMHTTSPAAFSSPTVGPLGWVGEGLVRVRQRPYPRVRITPPVGREIARPALVKIAFDDDGWWLRAIRDDAIPGLVVEAMGGGHMPSWVASEMAELAAAIPVVLTSRTGAGEVLRSTYGGFPGSETMLIEAGLIPAGSMDALKARILLALLLTEGASRERIVEIITRIGSVGR